MLHDLDRVLKQLLIRELEIKNSEVEIAFDQPSRQWSARLGQQPTLNLFLYDVRENQKLRQTQPMWDVAQRTENAVDRRRMPVRADLHYMVTAWATDPEDEHNLLGQAWMAFLRYPHLPKDLLPESLHNQPLAIPVRIAQYDELHNPTDIWNVLDNEIRPALACTITMALDPYQPFTTPLVRQFEQRVGLSSEPPSQRLDKGVEPVRQWTIGGSVRTDKPLEDIRMRLVERDHKIDLGPEGRFVLGPLRRGRYTLEVTVDGGQPRRFEVDIPDADVLLEI